VKQCVVSFGKGSWYPKGQQRAKRIFIEQGYTGDFLLYTDERQLGCKPHKQNPYAFKAYAFRKAYEQGYKIVIWVDSSIHLVVPYKQVLNNILKNKYMLLKDGWNSGQWCADSALKPLGITREESFTYPSILASVMAFDFREPICIDFLNKYYKLAYEGKAFPGDWKNDKNQVSNDSRVLGHRHDQTAAAILATQMGMLLQENLLYYGASTPKDKIPKTAMFDNHGGAF